MSSDSDLSAVCRAMRGERRVALAIHENPDSDAVGSAVGMLDLFSQLGVGGHIHVQPEQELPIAEAFLGADLVSYGPLPDGVTLYAVDCGSYERIALDLERRPDTIVNIDHHHDNTRFGDIDLVRGTASSTSEIVVSIAAELGLTPSPWAANALYAGISFDTGHFRHTNTQASTLEAAGTLVRAGADPVRVYQLLYETRTLPTLLLWAKALSNLLVIEHGKGLISVLTGADYDETGADENETEGIAEFLRAIHGVEVAALVKQQGHSLRVRTSMRSKGLDVSAVAALKGGGGHIEAAGFSTDGTAKEVAAWLSTELGRRLSTASS